MSNKTTNIKTLHMINNNKIITACLWISDMYSSDKCKVKKA